MTSAQIDAWVQKNLKSILEQFDFSKSFARDVPEMWGYQVIYTSGKYKLDVSIEKDTAEMVIGLNQAERPEFRLPILISFLSRENHPGSFSGSPEEQLNLLGRELKQYCNQIFSDALLVSRENDLNEFKKKWFLYNSQWGKDQVKNLF